MLLVCAPFKISFSRGNWDSLIGSAGAKTPDQTASELEQQRNVLVFLFPSLEMEVRAALGFVEIPVCIVGRWRKWFRVELPGRAGPFPLPAAPARPLLAARGSPNMKHPPLSTAGTWGLPVPLPGSAVAASPAKYMEAFFRSCWYFFLAAAWHNWSWKRFFSVHYQLLEELFPFLYKAVHV